MRKLKESIEYWKDQRDNYINRVKGEYKVKESRGMTEDNKTLKCPICNKEHIIDKYDFVDSCIGYFDATNFGYEVMNYFKKMSEKKNE
jgi:hypothetical protein